MNTHIRDIKLTHTIDGMGNKHTGATYLDEQGNRRASQVNGHLSEAQMVQSIQYVQSRIKGQIEAGGYYT